jgi:rhodanese-related sulfurtransferase
MKLRTMLAWLGQYVRMAPITEISAEEVRRGLGTGAFTLLDANLWGQWVRGHIPGAKYVGMEEDLERILPADRKAPLVFYCESSL